MKKVPGLWGLFVCVGTKVVTNQRAETKEKDERQESRKTDTADEP